MDYKSVEPLIVPAHPKIGYSPEEVVWKNKYRQLTHAKQFGKITHISSSNDPHYVIITASTRAVMYETRFGQVEKTFSRFSGGIALGAELRSDAAMMVAGSEASIVRVFERASRVILREFKGHGDAVHAVGFMEAENQVFSCSDDHTVRTWDLKSGRGINIMEGHTDRVRCGKVLSTSNSIVTGSYDGTIRLWDSRTGTETMTFDHGKPVYAMASVDSGNLLITAGDNIIKIWDLLNNRLVHEYSNHLKQVTSLSIHPSGDRLLSAGLDGHLKVMDMIDYEIRADLQYPSPIMSMEISGDSGNPVLAVGMLDGSLDIRKRMPKPQSDNEALNFSKKRTRAGSIHWFERGMSKVANADDLVIHHQKKPKLAKHDRLLKKFRHTEALDAAIETGQPVLFTGVMRELSQRKRLRSAIDSRDEDGVKKLIDITRRFVANPDYSDILLEVAFVILDCHAVKAAKAPELEFSLRQLQKSVKTEIRAQDQLGKMKGPLELIITSAGL